MNRQVMNSIRAAFEDVDRRIEETKAQLKALRSERRLYARAPNTVTDPQGEKGGAG
jgi:hypothetical protein